MKNNLAQRCQTALMHPVTLAAVGLLLVNDLVFKALWSSPWTTGKLSDLAWVVFACPLLAFLLSLARSAVVPRTRWAERAVFLTAYVGLPLLYACFNTFDSVHNLISTSLALISGRLAGTTPDPTDSLVIPLGLAAALWVWHHSATAHPGMGRRQLVFVVAGVAALAAVGTSPAEPTSGIRTIEITTDQTLVAGTPYPLFTSDDGGMTWARLEDYWSGDPDSITRGTSSAETPRGVYSVEEVGIVLTTTDTRELVYPTEFLRDAGSQRYQYHATEALGEREVTLNAERIAYHAPSGNVIATFGIQGVLVGEPSGNWREVAVGPYVPSDFSRAAKLWFVFGEPGLWVTALALCLSVTAAAIVFGNETSSAGFVVRILFMSIILFPSFLTLGLFSPRPGNDDLPILMTLAGMGVFMALVGLALFCPPERLLPIVIRCLVAMGIIFMLCFLVGTLQGFHIVPAKLFAGLLVSGVGALVSWYLWENWGKAPSP